MLLGAAEWFPWTWLKSGASLVHYTIPSVLAEIDRRSRPMLLFLLLFTLLVVDTVWNLMLLFSFLVFLWRQSFYAYGVCRDTVRTVGFVMSLSTQVRRFHWAFLFAFHRRLSATSFCLACMLSLGIEDMMFWCRIAADLHMRSENHKTGLCF